MLDTSSVSPWIKRYHPTPSAPVTLVCFPHAGGSASAFVPLSKALAGRVDLVAVQYPGRQDRRSEPSFDDLHELADDLVRVLAPWTGAPFALFGHSMGATVAFELARRLEAAGTSPRRLFVSGRSAPGLHRLPDVRSTDDEGLLRELASLSGTPPELLADAEIVNLIMPAIRSDYRAIERYRCAPGATVGTPVTVLVGDEDTTTSVEDAAAWRQHARGDFELRVMPGGHFYFDEDVSGVLAAVTERLLEPTTTGVGDDRTGA